MLEFTHSLTPALPALLEPGARAVRPGCPAGPDCASSGSGPASRAAVRANPGMRVPGAFNGFELGLRAILGQQVTVKAAPRSPVARRGVRRAVVTPFAELNRLTPSAATRRRAWTRSPGSASSRSREEHHRPGQAERHRARSALDSGAHHNPDESIERLAELPGIGQWTAHYIAMRALRWPDAFPKRISRSGTTWEGSPPNRPRTLTQAWRPWRSYAVMHIWAMGTPRSRVTRSDRSLPERKGPGVSREPVSKCSPALSRQTGRRKSATRGRGACTRSRRATRASPHSARWREYRESPDVRPASTRQVRRSLSRDRRSGGCCGRPGSRRRDPSWRPGMASPACPRSRSRFDRAHLRPMHRAASRRERCRTDRQCSTNRRR